MKTEMKYFRLKPEAPAVIGEHSEIERVQGDALKVRKMHLVFEGWFGDDLMKTSPVFYITEKLKRDLESSELSGISHFENIEVTKSENFKELYPNKELPDFFLFVINGTARQDDFGIEIGKLIVSEKALGFLKGFRLAETEIEDLEDG
ncbi:MAG: hypothetical protein EBU52_02805 [Cytophagia bacterium]|nr:hypothetical protein [Cytophagia bacterium]